MSLQNVYFLLSNTTKEYLNKSNPRGERSDIARGRVEAMNHDAKTLKVYACDGVMDQDKTVISKIMQRFRPIAPKPTVSESSDDTKSCFLGRNRRSKRKYVRVRDKKISTSGNDKVVSKKNGRVRKNIIKTDLDKEIDDDDKDGIVTLQLLPEKDRDLRNIGGEPCSDPKTSLYGSISTSLDGTVVESWLTVECVSDTCSDLVGYHILKLGYTDQEEERVMRMLEVDTCPWLVSHGSNRVCWVNHAYRSMIGAKVAEETIKVWLVVTMDLMEEIACMVELYGAVTCRVRVRYDLPKWRKEVKIMTVPCDVWRIRSGVFAWRLDVESALRLGM